MRDKTIASALAVAVVALGVWLSVDPGPDLTASGMFLAPSGGFPARLFPSLILFSRAVQWGSRGLGVVLAVLLAASLYRGRPMAGLNARSLLFLLAGLVLLPGLLANTVLKDHWGRARPFQIQAFGGEAHYTHPLIFADQCAENCSFVCGDCAVAFYMHAFGYVATRPRARRRLFWAGIGFGCLASLDRLAMGAHFPSDIYFAAIFMLLGVAGLYALIFGRTALTRGWRDFLALAQPSA